MVQISVYLTHKMLERLDDKIDEGYFKSRSDAIRQALNIEMNKIDRLDGKIVEDEVRLYDNRFTLD